MRGRWLTEGILCWLVLLSVCSSAAAQVFAPAQNETLTLPPDGTLSFTRFLVPEGVRVSFDGPASTIVIRAQESIVIEGQLDAGPRSLSLSAQTVSFGDDYFVTGSGGSLSITAPDFNGGRNFNPRGDITLNGARLQTGTTLPGETWGSVLTAVYSPIRFEVYTLPSLAAVVTVSPAIPEPASVALFLVGLLTLSLRVGLGLRYTRLSGRSSVDRGLC